MNEKTLTAEQCSKLSLYILMTTKTRERVGCVGCPMAGTQGRQKEFSRYPKYQDAYIRAFDKMLEERKRRGKMQGTWRAGTTGRDIFHWWMEDGVLPGQMEFDDLLLEEDEEW